MQCDYKRVIIKIVVCSQCCLMLRLEISSLSHGWFTISSMAEISIERSPDDQCTGNVITDIKYSFNPSVTWTLCHQTIIITLEGGR